MAEPKAYKGKLKDFKPDQRNLNRHTQRGRGMVEASQRQRGFGRPGFAAKDKTVLGGNLSIMEVAPDIGLGDGDVFVVETDGDIPIIHLRRDIEPGTDEAVLLAAEDNQSALVSIDFNPERLAEEIAQGVDFGGVFTEEEQKSILDGLGVEPPEEPGPPQIDRAEELRQEWGTELGQLWALGEHRLAVGDCTDRGVIERVMGGELANLCVTDPPYNVSIIGGTRDPRDKKNYGSGLKIENDDMSDVEFDEFLLSIFGSINQVLEMGGVYYICSPAGRTETQFRNAINKFFELKQCIVWVKQQFVFGRQDYHWRHESILYGWKSGASHFFCEDKTQDTVWEFDRPMRSEREHPTQKPVDLFSRMISNSSKPKQFVYDPFLGSGTTLIACENLNRRCRAIEIDPGYVAVTLQRFLDHTGIKPELIT